MSPLRIDYPISIAILYFSGNSADCEDTLQSVDGITKALKKCGHIVRTAEVTKRNWLKQVRIPGQIVFNLVEDPLWELYNKVGRRLIYLNRPQVGLDWSSFQFALQKSSVKRKMLRVGISTPVFRIFNRRSNLAIRGIQYPLIVKPCCEHAGIGIDQDSVVIDEKELYERVNYLFKHFPGEVLAEEFIEGQEIHATVIGNKRHCAMLPLAEITFKGEFANNWEIYTYKAKWEIDSWEYWHARAFSPARVNRKIERKIEKIVIKAYKEFCCRDIARFDLRIDAHGNPFIIDVNMCPSLNRFDNQDATLKSVEALGWSYEEFIETLVAITYKRAYGRLPDRLHERQLLLTTR